jgi:hypothetical protein
MIETIYFTGALCAFRFETIYITGALCTFGLVWSMEQDQRYPISEIVWGSILWPIMLPILVLLRVCSLFGL